MSFKGSHCIGYYQENKQFDSVNDSPVKKEAMESGDCKQLRLESG